jgi:hypothetical protein
MAASGGEEVFSEVHLRCGGGACTRLDGASDGSDDASVNNIAIAANRSRHATVAETQRLQRFCRPGGGGFDCGAGSTSSAASSSSSELEASVTFYRKRRTQRSQSGERWTADGTVKAYLTTTTAPSSCAVSSSVVTLLLLLRTLCPRCSRRQHWRSYRPLRVLLWRAALAGTLAR